VDGKGGKKDEIVKKSDKTKKRKKQDREVEKKEELEFIYLAGCTMFPHLSAPI
jgi:hypothetical protein